MIYQNKECTSHENKEVEPVQSVQMNIYQSITDGKDLDWLYSDQGIKRDTNCWTNSPTHLFLQPIWHIQVTAKSTSQDMATVFHARMYSTFIKTKSNLRRKKLQGKNKDSNFLEDSTIMVSAQFGPKTSHEK